MKTRTIILLCLFVCSMTWAQTTNPAPSERVMLWPGKAPNGDGTFSRHTKELALYLPSAEKATGAAVVLCQGGAYTRYTPREGIPVAQWLNENGVACIILEYRIPKLRHATPLLDAQRTIRLLRANADKWKLDPHRIGIMGFSAGGHVASTAATHFDTGNPSSADPIERQSSRPDFAWLVYPVITMGDFTHAGSKMELLGTNPPADLVQFYSNELQVGPDTPPVFLAHAVDDRVVSVENSRRFAAAMRAQQRPVELLELPSGGHGLNRGTGPIWEQCMAAILAWSEKQKILPAQN